ncbi:MAG: HD domain-containing phosphohydrolase [Betaproteobacteria bacterium]
MANTVNQAMQSDAQSLVDDSPDYVKQVSALAETHELSASEDIVSTSGIKLVASGTRIDPRLREKLLGHRLSGMTLEKSLAITHGVSAETLTSDIGRLIDNDPWFKQLMAKSGDPGAMRHGVSRLKLPHEILFRLTIAREQRPGLYQHTLNVTFISHYLALRSNLKPAAIDHLLVAALCHDLGELYIDPEILEPGHKINDDERRFIYVHPITGWLIIKELPGIDPETSKAVIQHQERLDGSGYPFALKAEEISIAGRILAAADISTSIMSRFNDHRRLSTLLRLNDNKYDRKVVDLLLEAIIQKELPHVKLENDSLRKRLTGFAQLFEGWSRLRVDSATAQCAPVVFLTDRIYNLRTVLLASGFDPDSLDVPLQLAEEDAIIAAELTTISDELHYQLLELKHEIERHTLDWENALDPIAAVAFNDWRRQLIDCTQY